MRNTVFVSSSTTKAPLSPMTPSAFQRSPWHSPVPYLFGGLAAMLCLIAFSLFILACSYWRLTGQLADENREGTQRDIESGDEKEDDLVEKSSKVYEENVLVIMAGDEKPTFLATPVFAKVSTFSKENRTDEKMEENKEFSEKMKNGNGENDQVIDGESSDTQVNQLDCQD